MEKQIDKKRLNDLIEVDYIEMETCFYKFLDGKDIGVLRPKLNENWVIRIDKETGELKCWNFVNGKTKDPTPYIQDLIKAGLVI